MFGLIAMYLRRWLHETPVFAELQQRQSLAAELPLKAVVREHRPAILLSMLLTWVLSAGIVVVILMTPTLLQSQHGFSPADTLAANGVAIVCLSVGCVLAGLAADRFGPGPTFLVGGLLLLGSSSLFYSQIKASPELLMPLYALAGLCVGMIGAIPMVMVKAFPAVVRFSGLSFSYNLAYAVFGGLTPILVSLLLKWNPLGPAYYVGALCLLFMLIGALLWRREERQAALA